MPDTLKINTKIKTYYSRNPKSKEFKETILSKELAVILEARWEYKCPYGLGRCDILSHEWLIEAKKDGNHSAKGALGQLLVYSRALNFKGNLALALIGRRGVPMDGITLFCKDNNIHMFYYNLNDFKWRYLW